MTNKLIYNIYRHAIRSFKCVVVKNIIATCSRYYIYLKLFYIGGFYTFIPLFSFEWFKTCFSTKCHDADAIRKVTAILTAIPE